MSLSTLQPLVVYWMVCVGSSERLVDVPSKSSSISDFKSVYDNTNNFKYRPCTSIFHHESNSTASKTNYSRWIARRHIRYAHTHVRCARWAKITFDVEMRMPRNFEYTDHSLPRLWQDLSTTNSTTTRYPQLLKSGKWLNSNPRLPLTAR